MNNSLQNLINNKFDFIIYWQQNSSFKQDKCLEKNFCNFTKHKNFD